MASISRLFSQGVQGSETLNKIVNNTYKEITTYAAFSDLPLTNLSAGDQAFVQETNRLYISSNSGWYLIAIINDNPNVTGVDASYEISVSDNATIITLVASDPEGFPLTYSYTTTGLTNQATITQNENVFTITPTVDEANVGDFSITFAVSDGVNITSSTSNISVAVLTNHFELDYYIYDTSFTAVTTGNNIGGIFYNTDGTRMWAVGYGASQRVWEFSCSPAWGTPTRIKSSNLVIPGTTNGLFFSHGDPAIDGKYMYVLDYSGFVYQYTLSTPWDINTCTLTYTTSTNINETERGMFIKPDGTKIYFAGYTGDKIWESDINGGPWINNPAPTNVNSFSIVAQQGALSGLTFNSTGTRAYVSGEDATNLIDQYNLSTPWSLAPGTVSYSGKTLSYSSQAGPYANGDLFFSTDGNYLFYGNGTKIYRYVYNG